MIHVAWNGGPLRLPPPANCLVFIFCLFLGQHHTRYPKSGIHGESPRVLSLADIYRKGVCAYEGPEGYSASPVEFFSMDLPMRLVRDLESGLGQTSSDPCDFINALPDDPPPPTAL